MAFAPRLPCPLVCRGGAVFGAWCAAVIGLLLPGRLEAVTLEELRNDERMTPKRFANHFESFKHEFFPYVQNPEVFLRTRTGDCDDYAILADHILSRTGFGTRIVRVVLVGRRISHAVCYVTQSRAYLDYNNRAYFLNLTRSGPTIREIAEKVAASFEANWSSATEYTYSYAEDRKHLKATVVKTDPPSRDPDRQGSAGIQ